MKKIFLLLIAVIAAAGVGFAQDVYTIGYRSTEDTLKEAVVFKNGELLYNSPAEMNLVANAVCLNPLNDNLFWTNNVLHEDGSANYMEIFMNDESWCSTLAGSGTQVRRLYWHETADNDPESSLFAAGYTTVDDTVLYAAIWRGSNATPFFVSSMESVANDVCVTHAAEGGAHVLYCGYAFDDNHVKRATVWRDAEVLYSLADSLSEALGMAYYHGHLYTLVNEYDTVGGNMVIKVYRDTECIETLTDANDPSGGYQIKVVGGDVYVCGWGTSRNAFVWKNGEPLYDLGEEGIIKSLDVTPDGLFYTVSMDTLSMVCKDGTVLYTLTDCDELLDITVSRQCVNGEVRTLPYFEGFETGATDWNCWTVTDEGFNFDPITGAEYASYWHRVGGNNGVMPFEGEYTAAYWAHPMLDQEGWLISPQLYLQPNRDNTTLTFQSYEANAIDYGYQGVLISTTGIEPSDFVLIWEPMDVSDEWKEVVVDLSDYQGETVYIAFWYSGHDAHSWLIDNISVEEQYEFCEPVEAYPFFEDFEEEDLSCYYIVDSDHDGNQAHWQLTHDYFNSEGTSLRHPRGEEGVPQEGWFITRPFVLEEMKEFSLSFMSYVQDSGEDMGNSVWVAVDVENPEPSDFTTCLWNDEAFANSWIEVSLDLSDYAGHTIYLAFKYEGTYAHGWYIDDIVLEKAEPSFLITVNANNPQWGYVFGGGAYTYGETCTLGAIPVDGYDFLNWTKEGEVVSTSQTYSFTVTEDATYTAVFSEHVVQYYTILTEVTPVGSGEVTGGGSFADGTVTFLVATPNTGWYFLQWSDGSTDNPRTVTVNGNATYTACFGQLEYELTVAANPELGGTVTGGGLYHYGDVVQLTATPSPGFEFDSWNDGVTIASRVVTVYSAATYIATFVRPGVNYYTINAEPNDPNLGSVTGGGVYPENVMVTLTAIPNEGARFTQWDDGTLKESRVVTVTEDATYIAYFEIAQEYTITVESLDTTMGTVTGGGVYMVDDEVVIEAFPKEGFYFNGWDEDNNYDNPRTIIVTGDATYHARFRRQEVELYTLTVNYDPTMGIVLGAGSYPPGTTVTVEAIPNVGYQFSSWDDGLTDFVRSVTLNSDVTLTAYFIGTSVGEQSQTVFGVYPNPAKNTVFFTGLEAATQVSVYDVVGNLVKTVIAFPDQEVGFGDLAPGLYFARIQNAYVRFILL